MYGEQRYSSTNSKPRYQMVVSGLHHTPATLPLSKKPHRMSPRTTLHVSKNTKPPDLAGIQTPDRSVRRTVTILSYSRLPMGRDSSVGKVTHYGAGRSGDRIPVGEGDFPHLRPTQLPIQWGPGLSRE